MRWNDGLAVRPPRMRRNVLGATKYATNILPSCHRSLIPDGSTERGRRHLKQMNLMGSKVHVNRRRTVRKTAKPDTPSIADSPLRILPIRHVMGVAHYVSQPPLPKVSGRGGQSVARRAGGRTVAGSLLSRRVHVAGRHRRY